MDEPVTATTDAIVRRDRIRTALCDAIRTGQTIKFGAEGFAGTMGDYRYEFEGEDDLLHLIVARCDGRPLTAEEGQAVAAFVLDGVPPAMVWIKPAKFSQHFYLGHELLLGN